MYLRYFSLREAPFSITPDTAFFFPHESAQAALNTLLVALRGGEGFLKIVGEVGCGTVRPSWRGFFASGRFIAPVMAEAAGHDKGRFRL